jgi:hypothetical protein
MERRGTEADDSGERLIAVAARSRIELSIKMIEKWKIAIDIFQII